MAGFQATRSRTQNKDHVLIFPFMAKGHIIPLLHLSSTLSHRGFKVTILTTKATSPFIRNYLNLPNANSIINLIELPFPTTPTIPQGCESTDNLHSITLFFPFVQAAMLLDTHFRNVLDNMSLSNDLPLCVISDLFLFWTRPISEDEFGIPRLVFHGMAVFSTSVVRVLAAHRPPADDVPFHVPGTPDHLRLRPSDFPVMFRRFDTENPVLEFFLKAMEEENNSSGNLINSFARVDSDHVALLESFYRKGSRAWLVGPLSLYPCGTQRVHELLTWLDGKKTPGSVVYVSFGTQADVSDEQLDEVGYGLTMSGWDFVWVVRSKTWNPRQEMVRWMDGEGVGKGVICRDMVPQKEVLGHVAVGGLVSHCGWNSVMEGVSAGVPILAWPMIDVSDQMLNAKYVVEEMGVGVKIDDAEGGVVGREKVCEGVRELMEGDGGKRARERVGEYATGARMAVERGGSSSEAIDELLNELKAVA